MLASGDSAKWPKGFNTASDAMWANNYIRRREKRKGQIYSIPKQKPQKVRNKHNIQKPIHIELYKNTNLIEKNNDDDDGGMVAVTNR